MFCELTDFETDSIFLCEDGNIFLDISRNSPETNLYSSVNDINFSSATNIVKCKDTDLSDDDLTLFDTECLNDPEFRNVLSSEEESLIWEDLFGDVKDTDESRLMKIDQSITDRTMLVETQPPENIRYRYESDGKRQIEKSRSKPLTISLPDLQNCQTDETESIWLQLSLITSDENPSKTEFLHTYKLEYHDDDSITAEDGSVRVPLKSNSITSRLKQLARVSIIKKKLEKYDFQLKPYNPLSASPSAADIYENPDIKSTVPKAKCFRDIYHLELSRIACQILIRKNDLWHLTDIVCKTNIMEEKSSVTSNKRSAPIDTNKDEEQIIKKAKLTLNSLPIIRV